MIANVRPVRSDSRLVAWWHGRGYEPVPAIPFATWRAEDEDVAWLQSWYEPASWPKGQPRTASDTLNALIAWEQSGLVIGWGKAGAGKTFYCKLATQTVRQDLSGRGALQITAKELSEMGLFGSHRPSACQIARCICRQISLSRGARKEPPICREDDLGAILAHCDTLAGASDRGQSDGKLYIFLDGLDKIYHGRNSSDQAALEAILDFMRAVAGGAGGIHLAVRVFLPTELRETITTNLGPGLAGSIHHVELAWDTKSVLSVAERRLTKTWSRQEERPAHLDMLLGQNAYDLFRREIKNQEKEGALSPRFVIETLSSVANYAAVQHVDDGPISGEIFRQARSPSVSRRGSLTKQPYWKWLWILLPLAILLLLANNAPARSYAAQLIVLLSRFVTDTVKLLANFQDISEAALLLVVILAAALFLAYGLWRRFRGDQGVKIRDILRHAGRFLGQWLPWNK